MSQTNDHTRATSTERGYNNRWRKARATYLRNHPLCKMHLDRGRIIPATVVDHIQPHRGNQKLFWDTANWQSLCAECHSRHKQRLEKSGTETGCNLAGIPTDRAHHWNQGQGG